jgi:glucose/arabinose dehydrogenase
MRRLLVLLTLCTLACSLFNTATPLPAGTIPAVASVTPAAEQLTAAPASIPPTDLPAPTSKPAPVIAAGFPDPGAYTWTPIVSGLVRPVAVQHAGDGSGRLFIIEQPGRIRILQDIQLVVAPLLDITDRVDDGGSEQGLLGLAFHPDFERNGFFYVNYTRGGGDTVIARFQATDDRNLADPNSEKQLLVITQPFPNHNGGVLAFGPDGYLYLGLGDGGSAGDPFGNGQSLNTLLGKILRIDVDGGDPYAIPPDNPYGNEIWAYGLRNPWRMSFDRSTGDLWIGDVGQNIWEEIDFLPAGSPAGANFGWNILEGLHVYNGGPQSGLTMPVAEYSHDNGCSVTGGYVYRGSMPEWQGIYLYGDFCTGTVWGLIPVAGAWQNQVLFETGLRISTFGEDESGEVFLADLSGGTVYRLQLR